MFQLNCWLGNNSRWWLNFILLHFCIFLYFFIFFYIKRCIALCTAKLRARVCNGGYFQMMVGGSLLPGQPLEPLLSPQPSASSHLNMSNPQKYPLPGLFSPQISFQPTRGAHQVATTPMYLFSAISSTPVFTRAAHTFTHCVLSVSIHYLYTDLSIPPPICPAITPLTNQELILSTLNSSDCSRSSWTRISFSNQFPWLQFLPSNRNIVAHRT